MREAPHLLDRDGREAGAERARAKPACPSGGTSAEIASAQGGRRGEDDPAAAVGEVLPGAAQDDRDEDADPDQDQDRRDRSADPGRPRDGRVEQAHHFR